MVAEQRLPQHRGGCADKGPGPAPSNSITTMMHPHPQQQHYHHHPPLMKPKYPLSAYNLYFQLERQRILDGTDGLDLPITAVELQQVSAQHKRKGKRSHRKSHGKISFRDLARTVAARWKELSHETRQVLEEQATVEKEDYAQQLKTWKLWTGQQPQEEQEQSATNGVTSTSRPLPELPEPVSSCSSSLTCPSFSLSCHPSRKEQPPQTPSDDDASSTTPRQPDKKKKKKKKAMNDTHQAHIVEEPEACTSSGTSRETKKKNNTTTPLSDIVVSPPSPMVQSFVGPPFPFYPQFNYHHLAQQPCSSADLVPLGCDMNCSSSSRYAFLWEPSSFDNAYHYHHHSNTSPASVVCPTGSPPPPRPTTTTTTTRNNKPSHSSIRSVSWTTTDQQEHNTNRGLDEPTPPTGAGMANAQWWCLDVEPTPTLDLADIPTVSEDWDMLSIMDSSDLDGLFDPEEKDDDEAPPLE